MIIYIKRQFTMKKGIEFIVTIYESWLKKWYKILKWFIACSQAQFAF